MIIITIISIVMLVISEVLPFLPTRYNGLVHSLYICLDDTKKVFQDMEEIKQTTTPKVREAT